MTPVATGTPRSKSQLTPQQHELLQLVQRISKHKQARWFTNSVDERHAPNYYTIIKRPMTLSKIREGIRSDQIRSRAEIGAAMALLASNAALYNGKESSFATAAEELLEHAKRVLGIEPPQVR